MANIRPVKKNNTGPDPNIVINKNTAMRNALLSYRSIYIINYMIL